MSADCECCHCYSFIFSPLLTFHQDNDVPRRRELHGINCYDSESINKETETAQCSCKYRPHRLEGWFFTSTVFQYKGGSLGSDKARSLVQANRTLTAKTRNRTIDPHLWVTTKAPSYIPGRATIVLFRHLLSSKVNYIKHLSIRVQYFHIICLLTCLYIKEFRKGESPANTTVLQGIWIPRARVPVAETT